MLAPYADDADVSLYIEQATLMVDEDLAGFSLSDERLRLIELNLAAHFATLAIERGGFTYQKSMSAEEGYANDRKQIKLTSTRFGQSAIVLDTSGTLANLNSPLGVAQFRVV